MRIAEALERFGTQLEADGRSIHTRRQYARHVRLFARWARDVAPCGDDLGKVDHGVVARFLASSTATARSGGGVKRAVTANALRSSLRNFLRYCHQAGLTAIDAGRLIRRARCSPPPPRAMDEGDLRTLLDVLSRAPGPEAERDHAIVHLLAASGLRIGSAIALDVEDLDLAGAQIAVRRAKGDAPDVVLLNDGIRDHLRRFVAGRKSGPLFLARDRCVSQRHVQRRFGEWLVKAGITRRVTLHSLRHGFANRLLARTGDLQLVRTALCHRSIVSTTVYARTAPERLRAALG